MSWRNLSLESFRLDLIYIQLNFVISRYSYDAVIVNSHIVRVLCCAKDFKDLEKKDHYIPLLYRNSQMS